MLPEARERQMEAVASVFDYVSVSVRVAIIHAAHLDILRRFLLALLVSSGP